MRIEWDEWDMLTGKFFATELPYDYKLNLTAMTAVRQTKKISTHYDIDDLFELLDNGLIRELYRDHENRYYIYEKPNLSELLTLKEETENRLESERERHSRLWEIGETTVISGAKIQRLKRRLKTQNGTINFFRSRGGML